MIFVWVGSGTQQQGSAYLWAQLSEGGILQITRVIELWPGVVVAVHMGRRRRIGLYGYAVQCLVQARKVSNAIN